MQMSSAANHALDNWGNQTMAWVEDDLKVVQDMAVEAGISLPQSALNREVCRVLKPRGYQLGESAMRPPPRQPHSAPRPRPRTA